ncbi:MAG: sialate O-acetylesterase [Bacteroidales bacterium]|nr:sialate O-acetylesterase [Bacteroidales bacterium]
MNRTCCFAAPKSMKRFVYRVFGLLFLSLFVYSPLRAIVRIPGFLSDNMVLQRDLPIHIRGWADAGESVTLSFNGQKVKGRADKKGEWKIVLDPMTFGGPYEMKIKGKNNEIFLKNILLGDVWICSGQSNMEFTLAGTKNGKEEIEQSQYPQIRLFNVTKGISHKPESELPGGSWTECNPSTSGNFSAVGYFFGRELFRKTGIPIGLINSSWGGTDIEPWISGGTMINLPEYTEAMKTLNSEEFGQKLAQRNQSEALFRKAMENDPGMTGKWYEPSPDLSGWKQTKTISTIERLEKTAMDGIFWFCKEIELPEGFENQSAKLSLGPIDDNDITFINGQKIGSTDGYSIPRVYEIQPGILHAGKNKIIIQVTDASGNGGITGMPGQIFLETGGNRIPLSNDWYYKVSVNSKEFNMIDIGPNAYPSLLYNAMIHPLTGTGIKGVIWYQGENNAAMAKRYRLLFTHFIQDWRQQWGLGDIPFIWAQLANFMAPSEQPDQSQWAELREAQSMALSLPNTAQAVLTDIGEANDIHPKNKQDVGLRMALGAIHLSYGGNVVYSGPVYKSMKVEGNRIILTFDPAGSGLVAKDKYGYLKGFAIAGEDHRFVWAQARIEGNQIIVHSDKVVNPISVRYAWANNPDEANLYNQEGFPASPFRTDDWPGITK